MRLTYAVGEIHPKKNLHKRSAEAFFGMEFRREAYVSCVDVGGLYVY